MNGSRPAFNFLAQLDRARIWAAGGNHEDALGSLPAARSRSRAADSVLLAEADELEARLRLNLGDTQGAHRTAERLPPKRRAIVEAVIALADSRWRRGLARAGGSARPGTSIRSDTELQLLRANVALVGGERDASRLIRSALYAAQRHGFVHTVIDTAPQLLDHVVSQPDLYPAAQGLRSLVNAYLDAKAMTDPRPRRRSLII